MHHESPSKILIVDDHPAIREALAICVARHEDLTVCGEAENAAEALRLFCEINPDILITDISLKNGNGIDLIKRITSHDAKARILVWSMHSEHFFAERALRAGAMGYVTKDRATGAILGAIREILAGRLYFSPFLKQKVLRRSANQSGGPVTDQLSDREMQVFSLMAEGLRTVEIAERLHLSPKTIETHCDRMKKKLELKDGKDLLRAAVLWSIDNRKTETAT